MNKKHHYKERDIEQLDVEGNYYCNHIMALTTENLVGKSEIAAELAQRDYEIDRLTKVLTELNSEANKQADYITDLMTQVGDLTVKTKQAERLKTKQEQLRRRCDIVISNAVIGPDTEMDGITDCYHVPIDDIESLK